MKTTYEREYSPCKVCDKLTHYTDLEDSTCKQCQRNEEDTAFNCSTQGQCADLDLENTIEVGDLVNVIMNKASVWFTVTELLDHTVKGTVTVNGAVIVEVPYTSIIDLRKA